MSPTTASLTAATADQDSSYQPARGRPELVPTLPVGTVEEPLVRLEEGVTLGGATIRSVEWRFDASGAPLGGTATATFDQPFVGGLIDLAVDEAGRINGPASVTGDVAVMGIPLATVTITRPDWSATGPLPLPSASLEGSVLAIDATSRDATVVPAEGIDLHATGSGATIDLADVGTLPSAFLELLGGGEPAEAGQPLNPVLAEGLVKFLGEAAAQLRVHLGPMAQTLAGLAGSEAVTVGPDLFFAEGSYRPDQPAGLALLARAAAQGLQRIVGPVADRVADPDHAEAARAVERPVHPEAPSEGPASPAEAVSEPAAAVEGMPAPAAVEEPTTTDEAAPIMETEAAAEPPEVELLIPPAPSEPPAAQQERIAGVNARAGGRSRAVRDLPSAEETAGDARAAVEEPDAQTLASAEQDLATALGERPAPSPEIVELCNRIQAAIEAGRPVDEDDLLERDIEEPARQAGESLNASVEERSDEVQGSYDQMNSAPVTTPPPAPEPLVTPPEAGGGPQLGAAAAAPDPIPEEDLSLAGDQAALDSRVEDADIERRTTEPLTEHPFSTVREGQSELGEMAQARPAEVAAQQQEAIARAQTDMQALQLQAVHALDSARASTVSDNASQQSGMVETEEQTRERVANEARRIFADTRDSVNRLLEPVTETAMDRWNAEVTRLTTVFRDSLDDVQRWIDERHSGVGGFFVAGWDALAGLPSWVTRSYDRAERRFTDGVCRVLTDISRDVNSVIAAAEVLIDSARTRIDQLFDDLPEGLRAWADEQRAAFQRELDGLSEQARNTRTSFVQDISQQAVTAVQEVQAEVEQLREEARGVIGRVVAAIEEFVDDPITAIINGLLRLVGIPPPSFWALLDRIQQVVEDIANDPENFINNLVAGVKQGFEQFFDNFGEHILGAFWQWLFSGLGSVGVEIPREFSVKSLVTFALQVMGITWPNIREILVRHIGEENVELIERTWELVSLLIEEGPSGIVEMIKEALDPSNIIEMILDAAIDFLIETLVQQAIVRVIGFLNPVGAIAQAIELIYKVLRWIFQNAARIFTFIETVVNGLADIIAGRISAIANAVERSLVMLMVVVIDLIAGLLGLGDLPDRIADVIREFQQMVLAAVDTVIRFLVERARALLAALGFGGEEEEGTDEEDGEAEDTELGTVIRFRAGGEQHRQWVELVGNDAVLMFASIPEPLDAKLNQWSSQVDADFAKDEENRSRGHRLIDQIQTAAEAADAAGDDIASAFLQAQTDPDADVPSDAAVESNQRTVAHAIGDLLDLLNTKIDLTEVFAAQIAAGHTDAQVAIGVGVGRLASDREESIRWTTRPWTAVRSELGSQSSQIGQNIDRPTHLGVGGWSASVGHKLAVEAAKKARAGGIDQGTNSAIAEGADVGPWVNSQKRSIAGGGRDPYRPAHSALVEAIFSGNTTEALGALVTAFRKKFDEARDQALADATRGRVVDFMRELGRAGVSRGVVLVRFRRLWELPENRDFVKDQFRRVQAGHHEWIPTNLIPEVVAAARSSADALMLDKWIDMQNEVRTPTSGLIFTDRVGVSSVVDSQGTTFSTLSGHVGAIYAPNPVENSQLTIGEYLWHDQLRTAFRVRNSPGAVLLRVKQIASTTVWDGRSVPPAVTYPGLYSRSKSRVATLTASQLGDDQQAVFQDLMKAFTGWIGKYST